MDVTEIWVVCCSPGINCDLTTPRIWPSNVNNTSSCLNCNNTTTLFQIWWISWIRWTMCQIYQFRELLLLQSMTIHSNSSLIILSLFRNSWQGELHKLKVMETNKAVHGHGVASCQQLTRFSPRLCGSLLFYGFILLTSSLPQHHSFFHSLDFLMKRWLYSPCICSPDF